MGSTDSLTPVEYPLDSNRSQNLAPTWRFNTRLYREYSQNMTQTQRRSNRKDSCKALVFKCRLAKRYRLESNDRIHHSFQMLEQVNNGYLQVDFSLKALYSYDFSYFYQQRQINFITINSVFKILKNIFYSEEVANPLIT